MMMGKLNVMCRIYLVDMMNTIDMAVMIFVNTKLRGENYNTKFVICEKKTHTCFEIGLNQLKSPVFTLPLQKRLLR